MTAALPDVSLSDLSSDPAALDWVGMQGIDLPITLIETGQRQTVHARADLQVDLPRPEVKGIHMSRLYTLLDRLGQDRALAPTVLQALLQAMVESHADCGSRNARLVLQFSLLCRRPALVTPQLSGWKAYPVKLEATLVEGRFRARAELTVSYSSTCPCSAALSRQLLVSAFDKAFAGRQQLDPVAVSQWLGRNGSLATPHSQRSEAKVAVDLQAAEESLGLLALIDRIEQALATPVQTAVKRADEQAFAALNGANLMFVEDAARRLGAALSASGAQHAAVHVRHIESLHPHDAVASAGAHP
ncbi:GTP cyclohydrolase FolE2 [Pseudomonas aestusnigri]|jgi:GTP cyclohydrolase IB|uniref:GTP cyclohydrolase FolE2 n=1 Tax=Halopseudomonas aestusnigri TaxID=857252 RepID=UPI001D18D901|nr:GTP cyclohydrolase FolE2 [Halopseudomonas aestusnigri]MCC4261674.1 GTP cyclohydrolase FolE2 [Halopseudomonas aestusnigri]MCK5531451.1 GTP cyclohydrolase I FolE2 [Halopseudomonas aestusnigri]|tara:strand:+ start:3722 stop:4627 length:906 start_codon:yes stop_codon:yes gene_type:complete